MSDPRRIAYFSMEIALATSMPTYSGVLGALAGDTIRSAADVGLPMVCMTLLHREGYFYQRLDASGWQTEEPVNWSVDDFLIDTGARTRVTLEGGRSNCGPGGGTSRGAGAPCSRSSFSTATSPRTRPRTGT